jgi:hypothetical protein
MFKSKIKKKDVNYMIDTNLYYRISIFGDYKNIESTSDNIITLMNLFKTDNFITSTFKEPQIGYDSNRILLLTNNKEWQIFLGSSRIDVMQIGYDEDSAENQNLDDFLKKSVDYCIRIMECFNLKANRLAFNTSGFCLNLAPEKIRAMSDLIFKPNKIYSTNNPFQWSVNLTSLGKLDFKGVTEDINLITSIGRLQGEMIIGGNSRKIDTIKIQFDINTIPENIDYRFTKLSILDFCNISVYNIKALLKNIEDELI